MDTFQQATAEIPQYSLTRILLVWAAAAFPMAIMGWVVAPAFAETPHKAGFERVGILAVGLVWQFILVMILLYQETHTLRWSVIRKRLWLQTPRSPRTGLPRRRLWWWLVPLVALTAFYELRIRGAVNSLWVAIFPFLAQASGLDFGSALSTPEARAALVGHWGVFALFVISAVFNTVAGEELLFRGLLLPRMSKVFGKWDWVMNGLLFGLYHLHQPWRMLGSMISGMLFFALPSRYFRSAWMGIIAHSGQSVYFTFLMLGLVLGLAA
jgi:uncharacterized protein